MANTYEKNKTASHFPEKGPIDEKTGKEILLSIKDIDITFGKGADAVKAVQDASFDIYKGEHVKEDHYSMAFIKVRHFHLLVSRVQVRLQSAVL